MNQYNKTSFFQNQDLLINSFNKLIEQVNIKRRKDGQEEIVNNFNRKGPNSEYELFETLEERVERTLLGLIEGDENSKYEKLHDKFTKDSDNKNLIRRLDELLADLGAGFDGVTVKTRDFNTPLSHLALVVAEARMHYHGYDKAHYNPLQNIAYEYIVRDISKWGLVGRSTDVALMTHTVDPFTREFEKKVISKTTNRIIQQTDELSGRVNKAFEDYQKGHLYMNAGMNIFDNLFEEGRNGEKFNSELRLKNPYDPNSKLTEQEREFAKFFLLEVNQLLHPSLDLSSIETEEARELISSGVWFKIPLMRSGLYNKVTSGNGNFIQKLKLHINQKID